MVMRQVEFVKPVAQLKAGCTRRALVTLKVWYFRNRDEKPASLKTIWRERMVVPHNAAETTIAISPSAPSEGGAALPARSRARRQDRSTA